VREIVPVEALKLLERKMFYVSCVARGLPAGELVFAETQLEALLSGGGWRCLEGEAGQLVALHSVEAPRPLARLHAQAALLRVDSEHRELRFAQGACQHKK